MSGVIIIALIALVFILIYQIAKAGEYAAILRGEKQTRAMVNRTMAGLMLVFFVLGMWGIYVCHKYLMQYNIPVSASAQGVDYDSMFKWTLIVTGIVFVLTQFLLFWFGYRYQQKEGRKPFYYAHNNTAEIIWTTIPAIAMAMLVAIGLKNWFAMTSPAPANSQVVEVIGKQFNWIMRYPGADGELGKKDFRKIDDASNVLGLDWTDRHNMDDIVVQNGELHVVVGQPVKLIIGSRDVIHDVGLPHFRMKMDAVPGITTTLWFTPTITTDSMKRITKDPDFVYEISCDQMCGKGHYSMRGTVIVETAEQHSAWLAKQVSYYSSLTPASAAPTSDTGAHKTDSVVEAKVSMNK